MSRKTGATKQRREDEEPIPAMPFDEALKRMLTTSPTPKVAAKKSKASTAKPARVDKRPRAR